MSSNEYRSELDKAKQINTIDEDRTYHSMTTSIYPANFDYSEFEKYKQQEFNRMSEDSCYNQMKDSDNNKRLKFYTTNHVDLLAGKDKYNFFGMTIKEGVFIPSEKIDDYSNLINSKNGGIITHGKYKQEFGTLPLPTTPYRGQVSHGDVVIEDSKVRGWVNPKKNACLPRDPNFEQRSFAIFDDSQLIETPNAFKSVETPEIGFGLGRNGVPSRFINKFSTKSQRIPSTGVITPANFI